mmetsp:Transcript_24913/g.52157  ORF Transcript_24913/g.52157 Transcript_24913/m.52157 type:complete len:90 (+) Transcript_24913:274-543(+)
MSPSTNQPRSHWTRFSSFSGKDKDTVRRERLAASIIGAKATQQIKIRGLMYPQNRAACHPAASMLQEYARHGCPVLMGQDWTLLKLEDQ